MLQGQMTELQFYSLVGLLVFVLLLFGGIVFAVLRGSTKSSPKLETKKPEDKRPANKKTEDQKTSSPDLLEVERETQQISNEHSDRPLPQPKVQDSPRSLKSALSKTEAQIFGRLRSLFTTSPEEKQLWEQLEEILYTSDIGPVTVDEIIQDVKAQLSSRDKKDYLAVEAALKKKIESFFAPANLEFLPLVEQIQKSAKPFVVMIVGVNGAGKTTSIGKLSSLFATQGLRVLVAAGDTFRAAASEQLKVWSDRAQVDIFSPDGVKDPSAVAFDAVQKAKSQAFDVVLIDTAGRLHTQTNLMEELKKVKRVMQKIMPEAPHETLIVLDANSGQNALIQAKQFHGSLQLTGAILTKMDGTAKGGVAIGLVSEVNIPIKYIGIGEKVEDLRVFNKTEFVDSLVSPN